MFIALSHFGGDPTENAGADTDKDRRGLVWPYGECRGKRGRVSSEPTEESRPSGSVFRCTRGHTDQFATMYSISQVIQNKN